MCLCVCVCENLGKPEERQNVWMHLRTGRDKKGSSGARGLLLGLLIPRPSHPFRACLRSDSLALRGRASSAFNMLCVPTLPCLPPPTVASPPPQLSLSLSGTLAACFKEPAKGTFQAKAMSLDKGESGDEEGMSLKIANCNFRYVYFSHSRILIHSGLFAVLSSHWKCTRACACGSTSHSFKFFFFLNVEAFVFFILQIK